MKSPVIFSILLLVSALPLVGATSEPADSFCTSELCQTDFVKLEKMAWYGSGMAATIVATAYATGEGVPQDVNKARRHIKQAARWREPMGMHVMSNWLRAGFILEQDIDKADVWLERAIRAGYLPAAYDKAKLLLQQNNPQADQQAIALLQTAEQGFYLPARYLLAKLYVAGIGVESDLVQAAQLFKKLALQDYEDSRQHFSELLQVLEAVSQQDAIADPQLLSVVSELKTAGEIEVIRIYGQQFNTESELSNVRQQLAASGLYQPGANTSSRIPGNLCGRGTGLCSVAFDRNSLASETAIILKDILRFNR